ASASTPGGGAQPSPARSGAPGALGLGLDVGVLSGPQSVAVEAPRDGFDRGPSDVGDRPSAPTHQPTDDAGLRRAHNPFQALARSARPAPARAFAVRPVPISEPVDLPLDTLARLAGLERAAGPEHTGRFNKIRQGNLLLTTD